MVVMKCIDKLSSIDDYKSLVGDDNDIPAPDFWQYKYDKYKFTWYVSNKWCSCVYL